MYESLCLNVGDAIRFKSYGKEYALMIDLDEDPINPRSDCSVTRMYCWHKKYILGDKHDYVNTDEMLAGLLKEQLYPGDVDELNNSEMFKLLEPYAVIEPMWLYDHSGISMAYGSTPKYPYNDRWDAGQVGWIVVLREDLIHEGVVSKEDENWKTVAKEYIETELKLYNDYLFGNVYSFCLFKKENGVWVEDDSRCGFYGDDIISNGIVDCIPGLYNAIISHEFEFVNPKKIVTYSFD